ncbi:holo-ACP synthase [SAR86 cluster bacterium]|nr:holo-ACP synthase [SAR86 cluster bacterium]
MIYGIGVDLCSIRRVQNIKDLNKFANKILTSAEIEYLGTLDQKNSVNYLAKQFAAKEALSKALGTGLTGDVKLNLIEIDRDQSGKPYIKMNDHMKTLLSKIGVNSTFVSLADDSDFAVATVILER